MWRKSTIDVQLSGMLRGIGAFFKSWLLPTVVVLVLFSVAALLSQSGSTIIQRLYTNF